MLQAPVLLLPIASRQDSRSPALKRYTFFRPLGRNSPAVKPAVLVSELGSWQCICLFNFGHAGLRVNSVLKCAGDEDA